MRLPGKKLRLLFALPSSLSVIGIAVFVATTKPCPGITEENIYRIRRGMSVEEVNSLFGVSGELNAELGHITYGWKNNDFIVGVSCFDDWTVDGVLFRRVNEPGRVVFVPINNPTLFERLTGWFWGKLLPKNADSR